MIDNTDKRLIEQLQRDGRARYSDLAKMLGTVEGTVRRRIKRLLRHDIIKIVGIPNLIQLGYNFIHIIGFQVKMQDLRLVANSLSQNPHICYLAFVTGRYDLIAIVVTRSPQELSTIIEKEISVIPSILRTETFVNLDIIKGSWGLLDTTALFRSLDVSSNK